MSRMRRSMRSNRREKESRKQCDRSKTPTKITKKKSTQIHKETVEEVSITKQSQHIRCISH